MLEHDRACGGATMELNMILDFFLESSDHPDPPTTHQNAQHWPINQDLQSYEKPSQLHIGNC